MRRLTAGAGVVIALGMGLAATAVGQTTQPATSQPATTQATSQPVNPLRSPQACVAYFFAEAGRAHEDPAAYERAQQCLDFGPLKQDQEKLRQAAPAYVDGLYELLSALRDAGYLDLDDEEQLPPDPATPTPHSIGRPPLVFILTRQAREVAGQEAPIREWRFAWASVEQVPRWRDQLDELLRAVDRPETVQTIVAERASPRGLLTYFLAAADRAGEDPEAFANALECLDFAEVYRAAAVDPEDPNAVGAFRDDHGTTYIFGMEQVLEALIAREILAPESLPDAPDPNRKPMYALGAAELVGQTPLSVLLVRRGDVAAGTGQWSFSADSVRRVPEMVAALDTKTAHEETPAGPEPVRTETRSARATLETFLNAVAAGDMREAVSCLDTRTLTTPNLAPNLAGKLWLILARRKEPIVLQAISDDPGATGRVTLLTHRAGQVEIGPVYDDSGQRVQWLFTADTVAHIESLYQELQGRPLQAHWRGGRLRFWALPELYVREYVVPAAWKRTVLGLKIWQWVGLPLTLLLGWLAYLVCRWLAPPIARWVLRRKDQMYLPGTFTRELRPMAWVALVLVWWGGLRLLDLGSAVTTPLYWSLKLVCVLVATVAVYRFLSIIMGYIRVHASRTQTRVDDVLVPLIEKTLKFVTVALGVIFVISLLFNVEVTPLFAGLGVGGFAVAFAAKDTIANFFGSVNVVLDRPFEVGDWVKINNTEGIVEDVGIRSSRIRTFWKSQIIVPNSEIMNATIENFQRRTYRRTYAIVSVTYSTTPEQLEAFCEGIRELIRRHPHTWKDYFHVYVKEFAASSIDIMVYCFHDVADWGVELAERHRLLLDIIRLAGRLHVEFAFPTQTVHLVQGDATADNGPVPGEPDGALRVGREEAARLVTELGHTASPGK